MKKKCFYLVMLFAFLFSNGSFAAEVVASKEATPVVAEKKVKEKKKKEAIPDFVPAPEIAKKVVEALNTQKAEDLRFIPGVGQKVAISIVELRSKSPIKELNELQSLVVDGKPKFPPGKDGKAPKGFNNFIRRLCFNFDDAKVELNKASREELSAVNGLNWELANDVIKQREVKPFTSFSEILEIKNTKGVFIYRNKAGKPNKKYFAACKKLTINGIEFVEPVKEKKEKKDTKTSENSEVKKDAKPEGK